MFSKGNWKEEGYSIKIGEGFFHRDGVEYVVDVFSPNGSECGYFKFNHWTNHPEHGEILHVMEAEVFVKHRRKGIASSVYAMMEELVGVRIHQEEDQQTELAKKLWSSSDRQFGK